MGDNQSWLAEFAASPQFWTYITIGCLMLCVFGGLTMVVWLLGLPGRIAVSRNHPDAEAVYALGWAGFLAVVPWIQAFIWAYKPTNKIDIRYLPVQEFMAEEEQLERLSQYAYGRGISEEARERLRAMAAMRPGAAAAEPFFRSAQAQTAAGAAPAGTAPAEAAPPAPAQDKPVTGERES